MSAFLLYIHIMTSRCLRGFSYHGELWTRHIPSMGGALRRKDPNRPFTESPVFGVHSDSAKLCHQRRIFLYPKVISRTHQGCQPVSRAPLHRTRCLGSVHQPNCQGISRLSPHCKLGAPFPRPFLKADESNRLLYSCREYLLRGPRSTFTETRLLS